METPGSILSSQEPHNITYLIEYYSH